MQLLKGSSQKQTQLTNEVVNKLRRVRIADRQYQRVFQRVIEIKFFGRAISNDEKVEKEIIIQRVAVQLTDGAGQNLRTRRGEFQLLRTRTQKYNKVVYLENSLQ